jgi:iron complex outermembrane receptor protein
MNKRLVLPFVVSLFFYDYIMAQSDCAYILRGSVKDTEKHTVAFATVWIKELGRGVQTDEQGNFILKGLCRQTYTLEFSHVECVHKTEQVVLEGDTERVFVLQHDNKMLQKVEIRTKRVVLAETQAHSKLDARALEQQQGQSLGEILRTVAGVSSLNTGSSISKPVVQGLHSDRVLILTNGIRQEGQAWGLDHAPEIDPFIADQIRVIKGAAAVRYGVGAIGGVVLVEPRPLRDTAGFGGELTTHVFSNGRGGLISGFFEAKNKSRAWRVQATLKRVGNIQTPQYVLGNTALLEANGSAMLTWARDERRSELFFSHFYSQIGIFRESHIGNLTDLQAAIQRGLPQKVYDFSYTINRPAQFIMHELAQYKVQMPTGAFGRLNLNFAAQMNWRREFDYHRLGGRVYQTFDTVQIAFLMPSGLIRAEWEHKPLRNWQGSVGTEGLFQLNETYAGALIPDYRQLTTGLFWTERWRSYPKPFEIEFGLRYDFRQLWVDSTRFNERDRRYLFGNISASLGAIYHLGKWGKFSANIGTAWRSPNVNELFSDGVHHGTASYEKGDATLVPERALNASLSFEAKTKIVEIEANLYQNNIAHFIFLEPAESPRITIRGAFPAFNYRQTDAILRGGDLKAAVHLTSGLWWTSAVSILYACQRPSGEWLPLMPADRYEQGLKYRVKTLNRALKNGFMTANLVRGARQWRIPYTQTANGEYRAKDYAAPPDAYWRLDAQLGTDIHVGRREMRASLRVHNLLNVQYRDYTDRFRYFTDAMGRNLVLTWKMIF